MIRDGNHVSGVVDYDRVVNVLVDDVVRRWRHIFRRPYPNRNWRIVRHRKHERRDRRGRRPKIDKINRPWRQKDNRRRRWRSKSKIRIVEHQHRTFNVNNFLRRRRRNIVGNDYEPRRGFKSG